MKKFIFFIIILICLVFGYFLFSGRQHSLSTHFTKNEISERPMTKEFSSKTALTFKNSPRKVIKKTAASTTSVPNSPTPEPTKLQKELEEIIREKPDRAIEYIHEALSQLEMRDAYSHTRALLHALTQIPNREREVAQFLLEEIKAASNLQVPPLPYQTGSFIENAFVIYLSIHPNKNDAIEGAAEMIYHQTNPQKRKAMQKTVETRFPEEKKKLIHLIELWQSRYSP